MGHKLPLNISCNCFLTQKAVHKELKRDKYHVSAFIDFICIYLFSVYCYLFAIINFYLLSNYVFV
jgi:hypothetical protein